MVATDLDVLDADLAASMKAGRDDPRLTWTQDRRRVRVRLSEALPPACSLTTASRSERLLRDLAALLVPHGWRVGRGGWWTPGGDDGR